MEAAANVLTRSQAKERRASRGARTRQEILATAVQMASEEGLEDLTIGRLADELGMSKSGLFAHFGSKEDLQLATIETAREIFVNEVVRPVQDVERGLPRLLSMFESWLSYCERVVFRGGCFFAAASAEFDGRPGPVRDRIAELQKAWLDAFIAEVREAQTLSQLDARMNPEQIAFEVHAYAMETNWAHQLFGDKQAFDRARAAIRRCLEGAATPNGRKLLASAAKTRTKTKSRAK